MAVSRSSVITTSIAVAAAVALSAGLVSLALGTSPVNRLDTQPTSTTSVPSTQYAVPSILSPQDTPAPTDTATSTPTATPTATATATPTVAPAPAPAVKVAAPQTVTAPAPAPAVAPAPIRCPAGSQANSNDGTNDTSCYPNICLSPGMVIPDPAHPECDAPFKP